MIQKEDQDAEDRKERQKAGVPQKPSPATLGEHNAAGNVSPDVGAHFE